MKSPSLLGLATMEAPFPAAQGEIQRAALSIFRGGDFDAQELARVFSNAGIQRRTLAWPLARYLETSSVGDRAERFCELSTEMLVSAARRAASPERLSGITHIVSVSSSGIAVPTLDARVQNALELPDNVRRVPIFGLGCAGGAAGLAVARDLAASDPDARVLLLVAELTSLTLMSSDLTPRNFVACALFGDGAAAAVIGTPTDSYPCLANLHGGRSHFFKDTEDLMGWRIEDQGWRLIMSPRIPAIVRREARALVEATCGPSEGATRPERWILHPGGQKVMDAYASSLDLNQDDLATAAGVLRDHGNMSAVTVLFVLERELGRRRTRPESAVLTAFGPGFNAEAQSLTLAANP